VSADGFVADGFVLMVFEEAHPDVVFLKHPACS